MRAAWKWAMDNRELWIAIAAFGLADGGFPFSALGAALIGHLAACAWGYRTLMSAGNKARTPVPTPDTCQCPDPVWVSVCCGESMNGDYCTACRDHNGAECAACERGTDA